MIRALSLICIGGLVACYLHAAAEEQKWLSGPNDALLVKVTYAADDKRPDQPGHTIVAFWISEKNRGSSHWVYDWAVQGAKSPDPTTAEKAVQCAELAQGLGEPGTLPASDNDIVTLSYRDGDQKITKEFSRHSVPSEVHEILIIMGFEDRQFERLTFISKEAEPPPAAPALDGSGNMNPLPESQAPADGGGR